MQLDGGCGCSRMAVPLSALSRYNGLLRKNFQPSPHGIFSADGLPRRKKIRQLRMTDYITSGRFARLHFITPWQSSPLGSLGCAAAERGRLDSQINHNIDHTREARELHSGTKWSCFILRSVSGAMLHRQAERGMW